MTGPTTAAGKARSSQNAVKHSLTGTRLNLDPAQQARFDEMAAELRGELSPEGAFENACFERIIHSMWRLSFAQIIETQSLSHHLANPGDENLEKFFTRMSKYRRMHENSLKRAVAELRQAQENRAIHANMNVDSRIPASPILPLRTILNYVKKFQNELAASPSPKPFPVPNPMPASVPLTP